MTNNNAAKNTDIEIWKKVENDYYSPSIHVTESGSIGINVDGSVIVAPVEKWHESFKKNCESEKALDILIDKIFERVEERNQENSILK